MAHTTKKMKLKRTMREVLDDEASAMSVEEELMNNVVKINGVWQFRSTQKISKRQKEAQVARIEEEKAEEQRQLALLKAEESDDET